MMSLAKRNLCFLQKGLEVLLRALLGMEADGVVVRRFPHADLSRCGSEIAFGLVDPFMG